MVYLVLWLYFFVSDYNAIQPYFYQYYIFFVILLTQKYYQKINALTLLKIVLFGIYLWSGIHKINMFYFKDITENLTSDLNTGAFQSIVLNLAYSTPFLEITIGLLILYNKLYKVLITLITLLHLGILLLLVFIFKYNVAVWPWNIVMPLFACYIITDKTSILHPLKTKFKPALIVLVITCIFPVINIVKSHFSYISWNLYSGKVPYATLYFHKDIIDDIPQELHKDLSFENGWYELHLFDYSLNNGNISVNPEINNYKKIAQSFCRYISDDSKFFLEIKTYGFSKQKFEQYSCKQLH